MGEGIDETQKNTQTFNICLLLFVLFLFGALGYFLFTGSSSLSIASVETDIKLDVFFFNQEKNVKELSSLISEYDIVVLFGVQNLQEKVDTRCPSNQDAMKDEEYQFVTKRMEYYLPKDYEIVTSDQVFDKRYIVFYNNQSVHAISDGLVLYHGNEAQYPLCSDKEEEMGIVKYNPYLIPFKTDNNNFTLIVGSVTPQNKTTDTNALEYFYNRIYNSWTKEVDLRNSLLIFTTPQCRYNSTDPSLMLKNDTRYIWLVSDEVCDIIQVVTREHILDENNLKTKVKQDKSFKITEIKMKKII